VQLTLHQHEPLNTSYGAYLRAVEGAFGSEIEYAPLQKLYGETSESEKRYSPAQCIGCKLESLIGDPDQNHISTSFVERHSLSVRMTNRRYARLTNAFSKKIENHAAAVALGYFAYNFIKIHRTVRVTPVMAVGVTDRLWEVSDLVALIEAEERGLERAALENDEKNCRARMPGWMLGSRGRCHRLVCSPPGKGTLV
jgi:hypothetical protein